MEAKKFAPVLLSSIHAAILFFTFLISTTPRLYAALLNYMISTSTSTTHVLLLLVLVPLLLCLVIFSCTTLIWYVRVIVAQTHEAPLVQWPVLRHLPALLRNVHRMNQWGARLFTDLGSGTVILKGPLCTGLELVLTCDPLNVEYVTKTNFANYGKGPTFVEKFDILGDGIFIADEASWFRQRKMAHSRITSKEFQNFYAEKSREVAVEGLLPVLNQYMSSSSSLDLQEVFKRFSFDVTCASILGRNPGSLSLNLPANEFSSAIDVATSSIFYRHIVPSFWWKAMRFFKVGWERRYVRAWRTVDEYLAKSIAMKREELIENGGGGTEDVLSMYMRSCNVDPNLYGAEEDFITSRGDKFFRDTALAFFTAGRDTVSSGLTWFFMHLCKTPSVEAKILQELRLVVGSHDHSKGTNATSLLPRLCSSEDLKRLVYLHAAILESMRLYPPVPVEHKGVREEDVLPDGTVVKAGTSLIYSMYIMGRMKWIWGDDCMDFKPERWIDERGKIRYESPYKYPVFNAGPRTCLGKNMAMTMMKMAAATFLLNFRIEMVEEITDHNQEIQQVPSVILQIKNGLKVRVRETEAFSDI